MSHFVHVSTTVSKLGSAIPTVNLPPIVTCRPDAPCAKLAKDGGGCYCLHGRWLYSNVQKSLQNNLLAYQENPKLFFDMVADIFCNYRYARLHSAGDIVDYNYLAGMCRVARKCSGTQILCYTKKYELVNKYVADGHKIPKNLHIVFSTWRNFVPDNPFNFPMSWIEFKDKEAKEYVAQIPENSVKCSGSCQKCKYCFNLEQGQNVTFKKH